jgi:hypothetical protein
MNSVAFRTTYLAAVAVAMISWGWLLLVGLGWVFGI